MKKFVSLLLCLALALGTLITAVGCTNGKDSESTDTESTTPGLDDNDYNIADVRINGVLLPAGIVAYQNNSAEKEDKSNEFYVTGNEYLVGTDNAFIFKPQVDFYDVTDLSKDITVKEWNYNYKLEVEDDGVFTVAAETYLDSADTVNCAFDFADAAEGKTFRLSVWPTGLTAAQETEIAKYTATFTFEVTEGYNAYEAKDLAYVSNSPSAITGDKNAKAVAGGSYIGTDNTQAGWYTYRNANNLTLNPAEIKAIIFHANIELKPEDITAGMIYTEEEVAGLPNSKYLVGSLKDHSDEGIYHRIVAEGDTFVIEGNYFTLDAKAIPVTYDPTRTGKEGLVFNEDGTVLESKVISHNNLFYFESSTMTNGLHATNLTKDELSGKDAYASIRNLSIIGNSPKTEDASVQGGFIFEKDERIYMEIDNVISKTCFITLFGVGADGTSDYKNIKVYDSFNSPVFTWGHDDMRIEHCYFGASGGPTIICTMYPFGSGTYGGRIVCPRVIAKDCVFDSLVSGDEAWFSLQGATSEIAQIKALNDLIYAITGRSIVNSDGKMNIYAVVINDAQRKIATEDITTYLEINGNVLDYGNGSLAGEKYNGTALEAYYGDTAKATYEGALQQMLATVKTYKTIALESTGGGLGYFTGTGIAYADAAFEPLFKMGEMMNLYTFNDLFGYLGVSFEYFN